MDASDVAFSSSRLLTREFAMLCRMSSIALQSESSQSPSYEETADSSD